MSLRSTWGNKAGEGEGSTTRRLGYVLDALSMAGIGANNIERKLNRSMRLQSFSAQLCTFRWQVWGCCICGN